MTLLYMSENNTLLQENNINDYKTKKDCVSGHFPCGKFIMASVITLSAFGFGCGMLITGGATAPLAPFYSSLISGSVAYWAIPVAPYKETN